jgi:hypothetical protein
MRKHRSSLFVITGLGLVGLVALTQPSGASAGSTGRTAALVSDNLATDSLAPAAPSTTASSTSTTSSGPQNVALASLKVPTHSTGPAVVDIPGATTTTGTTTPPTTTTTTVPTPPPTTVPATAATDPATAGTPAGGVWAELRQCESNGNYSDNTGNGYYGAYQFSLQTWEGIGYTGLPSDAPPAVQDQAAQQLQARSGWGQWPACAARLGLL